MENQANYKSPQTPSGHQSLEETVRLQLFKMIARNLDYAPSPADLPMVIQVMTEDLQHRGLNDSDAGRVSEAFRILGPQLQKWPTSRTVIEALPHKAPRSAAPMLLYPTSMDAYVDNYIANHPMSTKKDACLAFLKEKQLLKRLPESLSDEEARLEREAIQGE